MKLQNQLNGQFGDQLWSQLKNPSSDQLWNYFIDQPKLLKLGLWRHLRDKIRHEIATQY